MNIVIVTVKIKSIKYIFQSIVGIFLQRPVKIKEGLFIGNEISISKSVYLFSIGVSYF